MLLWNILQPYKEWSSNICFNCFWKGVQDLLHVMISDMQDQARGLTLHCILCKVSCGILGIRAWERNGGPCDLLRSVLKKKKEGREGSRVGKVQRQSLISDCSCRELWRVSGTIRYVPLWGEGNRILYPCISQSLATRWWVVTRLLFMSYLQKPMGTSPEMSAFVSN